MGLSDIAERLARYQKRLSDGKADQIKPHHIKKAIDKLIRKEAALAEELSSATKPEKRARLEEKLALIRTQIDKARWLADQV